MAPLKVCEATSDMMHSEQQLRSEAEHQAEIAAESLWLVLWTQPWLIARWLIQRRLGLVHP